MLCCAVVCVCRAKVRILVKDTVAAKNGYGPYVEPVSVDINSQGEQRVCGAAGRRSCLCGWAHSPQGWAHSR